MAARIKYPQEVRERAVRLVFSNVKQATPGLAKPDCNRIAPVACSLAVPIEGIVQALLRVAPHAFEDPSQLPAGLSIVVAQLEATESTHLTDIKPVSWVRSELPYRSLDALVEVSGVLQSEVSS